jgi:hypothetical protein
VAVDGASSEPFSALNFPAKRGILQGNLEILSINYQRHRLLSSKAATFIL